MSATPTLALVIPAFRAARFLPELFASIRAQHSPFDEVLVVDDASDDDTADVARSFGANVIGLADNRGCGAAKNSALSHIRSDFVHFHDADDLLEPAYVSDMRAVLLGNPSLDVVLCRWRYVDGATGDLISVGDPTSFDPCDMLTAMLAYTVPNIGVYRTATVRAIGGFTTDRQLLHNEDREFHLRLAMAGAKFSLVDNLGVTMRRFGGSMSQSSRLACLRAQAEVTRRFLSSNHGSRDAICAEQLWRVATGLASILDWDGADQAALDASRLGFPRDPSGSKSFRFLCLLGPRAALRVREFAIRLLKPGLRAA